MTFTTKKLTQLTQAVTLAFAAVGASNAIAQGADGSGAASTPMATSSAPGNSVAKSDRRFAAQAAKGGLAEVSLGKLAQQKASSDAVKQFASQMVDDHTKANDELKQIAQSKGIALPVVAMPDATSRRLQGLSGASFDQDYMKAMAADHKKTIALFEKEANNGHDSDLKAFASKTLPTLQSHQQMVKDTQAKLSQ